MFGTLVICLPSPHQGGDLVAKHRGDKKVFQTSAEPGMSLVYWYSDVHHEVLPVTSGYRWVLTYNLAIPPELERPSAALQSQETKVLRHALRKWLRDLNRQSVSAATASHTVPNQIFIRLDHTYTEANISLHGLKTHDLALVDSLKDMSSQLGFDILLAVLEKKESGSVEYTHPYKDRYRSRWDGSDGSGDSEEDEGDWHDMEEIFETEVSFKKIVDLTGQTLRSNLTISLDDLNNNTLLPPTCFDLFDDTMDRNEDYEGYMGNSVSHRDRRLFHIRHGILLTNHHRNDRARRQFTGIALA